MGGLEFYSIVYFVWWIFRNYKNVRFRMVKVNFVLIFEKKINILIGEIVYDYLIIVMGV